MAGTSARQVFRFGPFEVNVRTRAISRGSRRIKLPGLPFEMLVALLESAGEPVSREALHRRLWPEGTFVDFDNNLNAAVARLRQTLGDSADRPRYIETVPRLGYRFLAPVQELPEAGDREAAIPPTTWVAPSAEATGTTGVSPPPVASSQRHNWIGVTAVVLALAVTIAGVAAGTWPSRAARESAEALERARDLMRRDEPRAAALELQQAIRLDPGNALAHSTLAHALHNISSQSLVARPVGTSPSLMEARRAVEIDPECGRCQGTLGFFLFYHDWQWARAETHLVEAVRLNPEAEAIRPSYALLLLATGRMPEALDQIDAALARRPHDSGWLVIRASILYNFRRYADALAATDRALAIDDKDRGAWEWRSRTLFQLGRGSDAIQALSRVAFAGHAAALERAVLDGGAPAGLRALLALTGDWQSRVEHGWRRGPWQLHLGDRDAALDELERAYEQRNYNLMYLAVDPVYDPIRQHPRFQAIQHGMGLADVRVSTGR